jgi:hypothetical protein
MAVAVAVVGLLAMSVVDTVLPRHIQVAKVKVAMVAAVVEITAPAGTQVTAAAP